jgi:hypothetical protein
MNGVCCIGVTRVEGTGRDSLAWYSIEQGGADERQGLGRSKRSESAERSRYESACDFTICPLGEERYRNELNECSLDFGHSIRTNCVS